LFYNHNWEYIKLPDTSKFKSVGINLDSYKKLLKIAKEERRSIGQQVSKLVDQEYKNRYKDENVVISQGVGSIAS
tara:strand:+ start:170 stop:394 length:225 start_codon:yes stop_codon:yes gene_type:complete